MPRHNYPKGQRQHFRGKARPRDWHRKSLVPLTKIWADLQKAQVRKNRTMQTQQREPVATPTQAPEIFLGDHTPNYDTILRLRWDAIQGPRQSAEFGRIETDEEARERRQSAIWELSQDVAAIVHLLCEALDEEGSAKYFLGRCSQMQLDAATQETMATISVLQSSADAVHVGATYLMREVYMGPLYEA